jgi:hypothetical protein
MRYIGVVSILVLGLVGESFLAAEPMVSIHGLRVVVTSGLRPGDLAYVCATQPRTYTNPQTGESHLEVDHYVQVNACPIVPVR